MAPNETPETRKLVKTRLMPDLYAQLDAYRQRTHRSMSSAAEHLIAIGLEAERGTDSDIHTR